MSATDSFRPVTRSEPCVICGKPDWCRRTADGAHECHRVDESAVNGFVRIMKTPAGYTVYRSQQDRGEGGSKGSKWGKGGKQLANAVDLAAEDRKFRAAISYERKTTIAQQLGVSEAALDSIGIGVAAEEDLLVLRASGRGWKEAYPRVVSSFPECDATGAIVGICFRADDGRKGSPSGKVGAKRGLVIPSTLPTRPDPVWLVEGPSDVAACEILLLAAVGRPSNASGGKLIAQLLARRDVLVVGENDQNPEGTWPGREGAEKLARHLATTWKRAVRWALPPEGHKDVRAYLQHLVANGLDLTDEQACLQAGRAFQECLVTSAMEEQPPALSSGESKGDAGSRDVVLQLCVEAGDHFFHDNENRAFALVREGSHERWL